MRQAQIALEMYYSANNQYPLDFMPISSIETTYLSSYIKPATLPSFLNPAAPWQYFNKTYSTFVANYSCGNTAAPEYFIMFQSNIPLPPPFANVYNNGVLQTGGTPPYTYMYCISATK